MPSFHNSNNGVYPLLLCQRQTFGNFIQASQMLFHSDCLDSSPIFFWEVVFTFTYCGEAYWWWWLLPWPGRFPFLNQKGLDLSLDFLPSISYFTFTDLERWWVKKHTKLLGRQLIQIQNVQIPSDSWGIYYVLSPILGAQRKTWILHGHCPHKYALWWGEE